MVEEHLLAAVSSELYISVSVEANSYQTGILTENKPLKVGDKEVGGVNSIFSVFYDLDSPTLPVTLSVASSTNA